MSTDSNQRPRISCQFLKIGWALTILIIMWGHQTTRTSENDSDGVALTDAAQSAHTHTVMRSTWSENTWVGGPDCDKNSSCVHSTAEATPK